MDIRHGRSSTHVAIFWFLVALSFVTLAGLSAVKVFAEQPAPSGGVLAPDNFLDSQIAIRGHRSDQRLTYVPWRKVCFKASQEAASKMVCRTTLVGKLDTDQIALRIDLVEREGDPVARLQIFVPPGTFLQPGIKVTIDQSTPMQVPYVICLTNTCIAGEVANTDFIRGLETGETLTLETVNSNVMGITNSLSLKDFAKVHRGEPTEILEQKLEAN